jgi:gluconolactonase
VRRYSTLIRGLWTRSNLPRLPKGESAASCRWFIEKKLYVIDTGFTDGPINPSHIRVFDPDVENGKLSNSKVFAEMPKPSITDGLRPDRDGRIWCSVGCGDANENGVRCYSAGGELIGKIHTPETVANLCFGGQQRNRLTSLYAVYTSAQDAMKP